MNVEELDKALRLINGNLITDKECQYIRFVNENNRVEMNFFCILVLFRFWKFQELDVLIWNYSA